MQSGTKHEIQTESPETGQKEEEPLFPGQVVPNEEWEAHVARMRAVVLPDE